VGRRLGDKSHPGGASDLAVVGKVLRNRQRQIGPALPEKKLGQQAYWLKML